MTSDIHHYDNGKPLNRSESIKRQLERDAVTSLRADARKSIWADMII